MKPVKKKESRILQGKMESIQREITSLSLYARVHISSAHLDAQFPSALFFFSFCQTAPTLSALPFCMQTEENTMETN